jgi:predicted amidohydrolase
MSNISITLFQCAARDETPEARLNWLDMAADRAAGDGSRILIVPELYMSGYYVGDRLHERARPMRGEYAERVAEIASLHGIGIVYSYPEVHAGALYNSAGFIAPDGTLIAHHRKNHVAPGGYEARYFTRDSHVQVFDFEGWRCAILICYDIEFPEAARHAALQGAELLIVPTALGKEWPFVAEKMVPVRAFENGVFVAYANYAGVEGDLAYLGSSRVVGPDGALVAQAGGREELLGAVLDKSAIAAARARIPYLNDRTVYGVEG